MIKQSTRITESSQTLIDLTLVSNKNKELNAGDFDKGNADHRLIFSVLKLSRKKTPSSIRTVIDWKNCNQEAFKEQIALVPWHTCNVFEDIDDNYCMIERLYQNIKAKFLPQRKVKIRSNSLPWMNSEIRKMMNERYKCLRMAQKVRNLG